MSYYYPLPDVEPKDPNQKYEGKLHSNQQEYYQDSYIDAPQCKSEERVEFNQDDPPPKSSKSVKGWTFKRFIITLIVASLVTAVFFILLFVLLNYLLRRYYFN